MKQLLSILLALTMLICFAGCQFVEDPDDTGDEVVGGGLIQARDVEETEDEEVEDVIEDEIDDTIDSNDTVIDVDITDEFEYDEESDDDEDISQIELQELSGITPEEGVSFYALVISVNGSSLNVCGLNTTVNDQNHDGLFTVSLSEDAEITGRATSVDDITAGDIVAITYSGEVLDLYPGQILGATRVYVVTHIDRLFEIEYYLPEGYENFGQYFPAWDDFEY